jgi:lysozyme
MTMTDPIIAELVRDEGVRLKPYRDTVGKLTIGVGRNLDDVGVSQAEAEFLLANDVERTRADLDRAIPWWRGPSPWKPVDPVRQRVLLNMAFNMGADEVARWPNWLAAVQSGNYEAASDSMLKTLWARQVGVRANRLSEMMRTGTS